MSETRPAVLTIIRSLLIDYWRDARGTTLLVMAATLVGSMASISAPYLFSRAIDDLANVGQADGGAVRTLMYYALLFGLATAFSQASRFLIFLCAERLCFIANLAFVARLLRKTQAFFLDHNPAEIGTARQEGEQTLNIITQLTIGGLLPGLIQILLSAVLLWNLVSWEIAAIVLVYGSVVIGLDYIRVGRVKPFLDTAMERSQENASLVGNAVAIIDTIRQTRGETWMAKRFAAGAGDAFNNWRRYALASSTFSGILGVVAAIQLAVTFLILVPRYQAGLLSIGDIVLFNTLLIQLNEPFHLVGMAIKETVEAVARFRPLAVMWSAPETVEPSDPLPYRPTQGSISFQNVTFRYPNGRGISDLSFAVHRGTPTFLVGETGSGKSTVLRLLLKGLEPTSGRILADNIELARITSGDWFAHVGVVPQDVALLNDTLSANIVLGRPFNLDRLRKVAAQASILARIEVMPDGFDTVVGERGLKLSGGERQRIAIARALYGKPDILVLDEASSALDDDTERQIMDGLRDLTQDLTIIAVTHRMSSIQSGDQVVRLSPKP
ncbi:ABC transporter ATP-binding protein/permease [Rhizobium sp. CSW-27]|nr:ABC transporter ATP-binding protein/permease [Rhizobium sp. CSW-27]